MLTLTKHFEKRWLERVGSWPNVEAVQHFIRQSIRVQRCEDYVRVSDGRPYRVLAIYWHPELDLVIKVDTLREAAVTVMTRENLNKRFTPAPEAAPAAVPVQSALGARIARIRELFGFKRKGVAA